jgi:nucleotide-binding universal stress UspA family protein
MAEYKILVPLDGSKLAEHALVYISALRRMGECQVLLLSVVDEAEDFRALSENEGEDREYNVLSTYLREVAADLEQHLGVAVDTMVARGVPASRIIEEAGAFAPDLLIISTHGRSGLSRWRFGSVADKIIRATACNTLVIGPRATDKETWLEADLKPAFQSILVPLDGSDLGEAALPVARSIADKFGSQVHLVRAVGIPTTADAYGGGVAYMPDLLDTLVAAARGYIEETAKGAGIARAKTAVLVGPAAYQLEDYIAQNGIDLVTMTSHGRSGLLRAALGSVTDRLLGGGAPVLVVRPGHQKE